MTGNNQGKESRFLNTVLQLPELVWDLEYKKTQKSMGDLGDQQKQIYNSNVFSLNLFIYLSFFLSYIYYSPLLALHENSIKMGTHHLVIELLPQSDTSSNVTHHLKQNQKTQWQFQITLSAYLICFCWLTRPSKYSVCKTIFINDIYETQERLHAYYTRKCPNE